MKALAKLVKRLSGCCGKNVDGDIMTGGNAAAAPTIPRDSRIQFDDVEQVMIINDRNLRPVIAYGDLQNVVSFYDETDENRQYHRILNVAPSSSSPSEEAIVHVQVTLLKT